EARGEVNTAGVGFNRVAVFDAELSALSRVDDQVGRDHAAKEWRVGPTPRYWLLRRRGRDLEALCSPEELVVHHASAEVVADQDQIAGAGASARVDRVGLKGLAHESGDDRNGVIAGR